MTVTVGRVMAPLLAPSVLQALPCADQGVLPVLVHVVIKVWPGGQTLSEARQLNSPIEMFGLLAPQAVVFID
ncbi:hypothetical protein [Kineococcus rhizosphaerae]|uniref:hypothetical protein n=1 Tax=Kineococcus rhizosphaerae TaxID=559628 RepID=UPI0014737E96|nr:hypothetical protein [Kineococcus rhizosphaerae]